MSNLQCEMPQYNPTSREIKAILEKHKTVAIVGLSPKPQRDSHRVAKYLKENGYRIVPVNPGQKEILGEKCYPNLKAIPFPIEIVVVSSFLCKNLFRQLLKERQIVTHFSYRV